MSQKSSKKAKPAPAVPRQRMAIEEEYGRLVSQMGQAQYQVTVYQEEVTRMSAQLRNLNYEAAARQNLDRQEAELAAKTKAEAPAEPKAEEVKS